jgi:enoyl-CoA hydratase/carnithine racemase
VAWTIIFRVRPTPPRDDDGMCDHDQKIETSLNQGVLRLTINRPEKRNAIDPDMYEILIKNLDYAREAGDVRVVLICAKGEYFSAGNDRDGFKTVRDMPHSLRPGFRFMNAVATFPKPIVAAVNGPAIGIAVTLLLQCDLVYAKNDIELKLPFIEIGLQPEFASTLLLPRLVGYSRAAEIFMLGEPLSAVTAHSLGIINELLVNDADLLSRVNQVSQRLANKPPGALETLKRQLRRHHQCNVIDTIESETIEINKCLHTLFS